ncbi:CidA/LrgA family holin-like protein [Caldibacillus lycopersici]|uniref:CidA/LrgA family holin-like protein n=1 Tax=Perspicuibacillus lycopersici TaxID=1325689 RepID=A0AAE3LPZ6_9BACI|nr:CidA/LrgA family holin-like protein [Perspicuibacillus lycopersici]MCU9612879.1 CidA/LrgA family holin-like protein [Perspicuibacillus lycopersici]
MKLITTILQILLIHLFFFIGVGIKSYVPIPIPASMIGLLVLLLALFLKLVKIEWIEKGGNWLLAELLLFFIPSAVGIVDYEEILGMKGMEMILLIGISTFIVLGTTAFIADSIQKHKGSATK